MNVDDLFLRMTNDVVSTFGSRREAVYRSANRSISSVMSFMLESEWLGTETRVLENRWLVLMDRADIDNPQRGDTVTDGSGQIWVLQQRIVRDEWMDVWAIQAK